MSGARAGRLRRISDPAPPNGFSGSQTPPGTARTGSECQAPKRRPGAGSPRVMMIDPLLARSKKQLADMARKKGVAGWQSMRKEALVKALGRVRAKQKAAAVNGKPSTNGKHPAPARHAVNGKASANGDHAKSGKIPP